MNPIKLVRRGIHTSIGVRGTKGYDWYYKHLERVDKEARDKAELFAKPILPPPRGKRTNVFFDFQTEKAGMPESMGRITFRLCDDYLPKTCANFLSFVENGYKKTNIDQVLAGKFFAAGDSQKMGRFVEYIPEEAFLLRHRRGVLSMSSAGTDRIRSEFFVVDQDVSKHLDGLYVGFGEVIQGLDVLSAITNTLAMRGKPLPPIQIVDCGIISKTAEVPAEFVSNTSAPETGSLAAE